MTEKINNIIESISNLTVLELSELVKQLEEKFGVQAGTVGFMPQIAVSGVQAGVQSTTGQQEQKTEFTVVLTNAGSNKIQVIKVVREITGLGLKEAKDLVDSLPKPIKENIPKEQAEDIKKKIEAAGGIVEIK